MNTFTLEPSLIGLTTTGNFNFFSILLIICFLFSRNEYSINFGVRILFFIKIFLDNILSMAIAEEITPECVYGITVVSRIVWIKQSSPNWPCNELKIIFGLNESIALIKLWSGSTIFVK